MWRIYNTLRGWRVALNNVPLTPSFLSFEAALNWTERAGEDATTPRERALIAA